MLEMPGKIAVECEDLLKELESTTTQFDILRFLKKTTERFGARAFLVIRMPSATATALQSASVITSWPSELIARYDAENLLTSSPILKHMRASSVPMSYDVTRTYISDDQSSRETRSLQLFEQYRMQRGAFFPVCDANGDRGAIGFSGDRAPFEHLEMMQLLTISTYVFDRIYQVSRRDKRAGEDLTQREIDCLNWTAAGKTSLEISEILSLSEHTVNHYLNRATKKLDTVNRTQAVAKALRMGIIS